MNKLKYTIEYDMKRTPISLIWNHIATASGLSQWFADKVIIEGKDITFIWNKTETHAYIIGTRTENYIRFRWEDDVDNDKVYVELKINYSDLTDSSTLMITDFAVDEYDEKESIELWDSEVEKLQRIMGCL